jgi:hypothetical protein
VNAVKTIAMAATLLLIITCSAQEGHGSQRDTRCCLLEVLHSEELSIGPLLYHTIKVAFLVTAPDVTPFETTVMANADAPAGQRVRPGAIRQSSIGPLASFGLFVVDRFRVTPRIVNNDYIQPIFHLRPELDQTAVMSVVHPPTLQRIPTVPSGGTHSHIGKRLLVGSIVQTFSNQRIDRATNLKAAAREI